MNVHTGVLGREGRGPSPTRPQTLSTLPVGARPCLPRGRSVYRHSSGFAVPILFGRRWAAVGPAIGIMSSVKEYAAPSILLRLFHQPEPNRIHPDVSALAAERFGAPQLMIEKGTLPDQPRKSALPQQTGRSALEIAHKSDQAARPPRCDKVDMSRNDRVRGQFHPLLKCELDEDSTDQFSASQWKQPRLFLITANGDEKAGARNPVFTQRQPDSLSFRFPSALRGEGAGQFHRLSRISAQATYA